MDKTTQERLLDSFTEAAGREVPDPLTVLAATEDLVAALGENAMQTSGPGKATAPPAAQAPLESGIAPRTENTQFAAVSNTTGSGGGVTAASVAKTVLESGLGLIPLIGGLIGLFSGGDSGSPPPTKYVMPESLDFQATDSGGVLTGVSYDQMGTPRALEGGTASSSSTSAGGSAGGSANEAGAAPTQTAASAQTMDARWFMDHSADIAAAVRYAMLNLNSINDVVSDL
jgi:hypothetical protein